MKTKNEFIMNEEIDYTDIPETNDDFWKDAKLMVPIKSRLSKENHDFLLEMDKSFEIALNETLDVYRKLFQLAKAEVEKNQKVA
jgi:hypothetical protein